MNCLNENASEPMELFPHLDKKVEKLLGHFRNDFEILPLSREVLGPKYGDYGSFMPAQLRTTRGPYDSVPNFSRNQYPYQKPPLVPKPSVRNGPIKINPLPKSSDKYNQNFDFLVNPSHKLVKPSKKPVNHLRDPVKPVQRPVKPTNESVKPIHEPVKPVKSVRELVKLFDKPVNPVQEPVKPVKESVKPVHEPVKPVKESVKPVHEPVKLVKESFKPVHEPVKPVQALVKPGHESVKQVKENKEQKVNSRVKKGQYEESPSCSKDESDESPQMILKKVTRFPMKGKQLLSPFKSKMANLSNRNTLSFANKMKPCSNPSSQAKISDNGKNLSKETCTAKKDSNRERESLNNARETKAHSKKIELNANSGSNGKEKDKVSYLKAKNSLRVNKANVGLKKKKLPNLDLKKDISDPKPNKGPTITMFKEKKEEIKEGKKALVEDATQTAAPEKATENPVADDWVECDWCNKWRLLPYWIKPEDLPDKWECSMITWLGNGMNSCTVSEETTNAQYVDKCGPSTKDPPKNEAPAGTMVPKKEAPAGTMVPKKEVPAGIMVPKKEAPVGTMVPKKGVPAGIMVPKKEAPVGTMVLKKEAPSGTMVPKKEVPAGTMVPKKEVPAGIMVPKKEVPAGMAKVVCNTGTKEEQKPATTGKITMKEEQKPSGTRKTGTKEGTKPPGTGDNVAKSESKPGGTGRMQNGTKDGNVKDKEIQGHAAGDSKKKRNIDQPADNIRPFKKPNIKETEPMKNPVNKAPKPIKDSNHNKPVSKAPRSVKDSNPNKPVNKAQPVKDPNSRKPVKKDPEPVKDCIPMKNDPKPVKDPLLKSSKPKQPPKRQNSGEILGADSSPKRIKLEKKPVKEELPVKELGPIKAETVQAPVIEPPTVSADVATLDWPAGQKIAEYLKKARELKHQADRFKNAEKISLSLVFYFAAGLKFLDLASLLEPNNSGLGFSAADAKNCIQMYLDTAMLFEYCVKEYEKENDQAGVAMAYKCMEVAFMRSAYFKKGAIEKYHQDFQSALQKLPAGGSPLTPPSDVESLINPNGTKNLTCNLISTLPPLLDYIEDASRSFSASMQSRAALLGTEEKVEVTKCVNFSSIGNIKKFTELSRKAVNSLRASSSLLSPF